MAHRTALILVVGLTERVLGAHTPNLSGFARAGAVTRLEPCLPAVTCSVQSSMLTGLSPAQHGVVGNGWFDRDSAEIRFWKQSNRLVHAEKVWETAQERDPSVTCATMFWWFNMYSSAHWSVTPRPQYRADGRKVPDCYSSPAGLRDDLQADLGRFPLFRFWGPASGIASSEWIARASAIVDDRHEPTLSLVYLPHLDYAHQKYGPDAPESVEAAREIDGVVGPLIDGYRARGARVMVLSEYAIEPVNSPVHINRALREAGLLEVRVEDGREHLDAGASAAFAVADHQVAHVYVRAPEDVSRVRSMCESLEGVGSVLDGAGQREAGISHERAGEIVLVAAPGSWFTYYYWLDDSRAPDFARTVDIHRKPGYDPCELFIDPEIAAPKLALARKLIRKKLGFRTLMDLIPLDASLVRGSHGRVSASADRAPVLISDAAFSPGSELPCAGVRDVILDHLFSAGG